MSANPFAVAARRSLRLLLWQVACVVVLAMIVAGVRDIRAAWSVLVGGGISLLWTAYLGLTLFRHSVDYGARVSAASLFKGWLLKIVMTAVLLFIAMRSERVDRLAVLGGLIVAMVAYWAWFAFDMQRHWPKQASEDAVDS